MQTNLFKARNGKVQGTEKRRDFADKLCLQMQTMGARFADKVCLKMQTNFADKPLQDTPPPQMQTNVFKNADARAGGLGKLQTNYADKGCLRIGRGRLHSCSSTQRCRGCLQRNADKGCLQRNADKVCLQLQHVCFFGWFVQFIYSLFHFFGLSSQHHAFRFLGIRFFDSAPPVGCGRAGAGFLAGFFDFFSACPVFAWFLAFCKAEAERQF